MSKQDAKMSRFSLKYVNIEEVFEKLKDGDLKSIKLSDIKKQLILEEVKHNNRSVVSVVSEFQIISRPSKAQFCYNCLREFSKIKIKNQIRPDVDYDLNENKIVILGLPIKMEKNVFYCIDALCSTNCCLSYCLDKLNLSKTDLNQIIQNIHKLHSHIVGDKGPELIRSPDFRILEQNGGDKSYEKYDELCNMNYIWSKCKELSTSDDTDINIKIFNNVQSAKLCYY